MHYDKTLRAMEEVLNLTHIHTVKSERLTNPIQTSRIHNPEITMEITTKSNLVDPREGRGHLQPMLNGDEQGIHLFAQHALLPIITQF